MPVTAFFNFRIPDAYNFANRTSGAIYFFRCSTTAEMNALTNLIDGDTARCLDSGIKYVRTSGAWAVDSVDPDVQQTADIDALEALVATLQSTKANTSSLATVATSGSYADLSNKPTIPADQSSAVSALQSRTISTTGPLTGGGDLSANRTFAISAASTSAAGSMSAADKTKLDGIANGATALSLASTAPAALGTVAAVGVGTTAARADHVHKGPIIRTGTGSTAAILLAGNSVDVTVTFAEGAMPDTNYSVSRFINPTAVSLLSNLAVVVKTKNTANVVMTLTNTGLATVALGQIIEVIAINPGT